MKNKSLKKVRKTRVSRDNEVVTRRVLREELKGFATKEDLKQYATKEDLKNELKKYATKEDLRQEIGEVKESISHLPTKHDLLVWKDEIVTMLKEERKEHDARFGAIQRHDISLEDHEERISTLERGEPSPAR